MERTFDIDGRRILLKFHREKGQIFCKTVEFFEPQERALVAQTTLTQISQTKRYLSVVLCIHKLNYIAVLHSHKHHQYSLNQFLSSSTHSEHSSTKEAAQLEAQPILRPDDVKIYLVDPRDEKPCLRELSDIYKEQVFSEIVFLTSIYLHSYRFQDQKKQ